MPAAAACVVSGDLRPLALLVVTIPVLVAGALVNVFRGSFSPALLVGADTPLGNTAALSVVFWYAWGTVLAVLPMTVLVSSALRSPGPGPARPRPGHRRRVSPPGLGVYAARRAGRLRAGRPAAARRLNPSAPAR